MFDSGKRVGMSISLFLPKNYNKSPDIRYKINIELSERWKEINRYAETSESQT
jgi:hypothetical protein